MKLENILDKKVEELLKEGNKHKYHFIDLPSEVNEELTMSYKYARNDDSVFNFAIRTALAINLIVEYNGYTFMLRDL